MPTEFRGTFDKTLAPIEHLINIFDACTEAESITQIVQRLRQLHREFLKAGVPSLSASLYRPGVPADRNLVVGMMEDSIDRAAALAGAISVTACRAAERIAELANRVDAIAAGVPR